MNDVLDFVITYWKEILSVLCLLVSVLIHLLKKRPCYNMMDEIKEDVLEVLPIFIKGVESPGDGQRKKTAVLDLVKSFVEKKFKIDCPTSLIEYASNHIEGILSTPTKKGE